MVSTICRVVGRVILVITSGALLAACGGNSAGPNATGPATVMSRTSAVGAYLTDGAGRTLYLFVADKGGTSTCFGGCAADWPPLTTMGTPQAGSGVTGSKLGTVSRGDGTTQVTYDKHPLYVYVADSSAGDLGGQGVNAFGGLWWLVSPDGAPITSPAPASTTPPREGGGYGY